MKKTISTAVLFLIGIHLMAQDTKIEMADSLYSSGKIYVVVISIAIILTGLFLFLFSIDRRLKKLENNSQG